MSRRISERDLIIPALFCIRQSANQELSTTELQECLRRLLRPAGEDLELLDGRGDDKFSQKVRNLKSHNTLERLGLCNYAARQWRLTELGEVIAERNQDFLTYLLENGFHYEDVSNALEVTAPENPENLPSEPRYFDENLTVTEGATRQTTLQVRIRSAALRDYAIQYYSQNGSIACQACGFNFEDFYGPHGAGFIEIHHVKPIVAYSDEEIERTIEEALANVVPVCANCHRMIHRERNNMLSIDELRQMIEHYRRQ